MYVDALIALNVNAPTFDDNIPDYVMYAGDVRRMKLPTFTEIDGHKVKTTLYSDYRDPILGFVALR